MPATGLEGLLGDYGVEITTDRLMSVGYIELGGQIVPSRQVIVEINPELVKARTNEVATAFAGYPFMFGDMRLIRPGPPGRRPEIQAQALLTTVSGRDVWAERDWQMDASTAFRQIQRREPEMLKKLSPDPLPAAVMVTEGGKPKLAAFGNTSFVGNREVGERSGTQNFSLFASLLDWLAERPTSIGIEPRNLSVYSLEPTVRFSNLIFLPGLLAAVTILGLGLGVWVVRRR
jgi:hypothetical protein